MGYPQGKYLNFEVIMQGSIHSNERCPICGSKYRSYEPEDMHCPNHPGQHPSSYIVRLKKLTKRFRDYRAAHTFLTGLRYELSAGTFDERKYAVKTEPLSFTRMAEKWLEAKKPNMKPNGWGSIKAIMAHAIDYFGSRNIQTIKYGHIEDFLASLKLASKTKLNILTTLKQFWKWVARREDVAPITEWPEIGHVTMAFRKTIDLRTQEAIIEDIRAHEPFRVWLCIHWLSIYVKIRPSEMLSLNEGDVDRRQGLLIVRDTKEREPKFVTLTGPELALVRSLPLAFDRNQPFFCHDGHRGHTRPGQRFTRQMLWEVWKRACKRLGIEGVDLYGGTKHSTAKALREIFTYEEVRKATGHTTNKAFDRYIKDDVDFQKAIYSGRQALLDNADNARPSRYPDNGMTTGKKKIRSI